MEQFFVRGGRPLHGTIRVSGSKNGCLGIMAAALLVKGKTTLHNVPDIRDIYTMVEMLRQVGAEVKFLGNGSVCIDATGFDRTQAPESLVRAMRASFYVFGPMLARLGRAEVSQPGGCEIGARPIDFHLKGMQALGAKVEVNGGIVRGEAARLHGAQLYLDFPSAGATTHLMITSCLAPGKSTIENAATEPEISDLAAFLNHLGARIDGAGSDTINIDGVEELKTDMEFSILPDRIEAGTFACAAAITRGDVVLDRVVPSHLLPVLVKLQDMGVEVLPLDTSEPEQLGRLRVRATARTQCVDILAMPHPGFPTDLQQPIASLLSVSQGTATVTDQVFENRFKYAGELARMGANIRVEGRSAFITGVEKLCGASVLATDLRAGAALVVAALAANGETIVSGIDHIDRGYSGLVEKLRGAGADIVRADQTEPRTFFRAV